MNDRYMNNASIKMNSGYCGEVLAEYIPKSDKKNEEDYPVTDKSTARKKITRIGIGGPVGSGKTAIIEVITPILIKRGIKPLIITNDIVTTEDAKQVKRTLKGILDEEKILGVETGACPHTAVREDPSMNIAAVEEMEERFPESDLIMIESGGDNLTLTFSPALADFYIYVIDVAEGEKIPRKNGPGLVQADILVINKIDLAPYVGASLDVMESDTKVVRGNRPYILTNCKTGQGIEELVDMIMRDFLFTHVQPEGEQA
ncbi:urease accessory protein [Yersinia pseudotuberculosis]|uniref:Urease accessory protein UreG n=4 Tax=Yersinia pseudotuberculosis complex TaxID=1649845 RepID=A0A0T9QMD4_9GAMM|nr:Urease accessory protein UreG [Yersinia pseudotuberculosis]CFQ50983.1 urease accessory protein [Yersinia similis]CNB11559.1 urease accessory protein [Yersinia similis]CNF14250.1 urease accessory protein [Yersinia similis]CNF61690.1 urease accessory protein [Yersinia similis]